MRWVCVCVFLNRPYRVYAALMGMLMPILICVFIFTWIFTLTCAKIISQLRLYLRSLLDWSRLLRFNWNASKFQCDAGQPPQTHTYTYTHAHTHTHREHREWARQRINKTSSTTCFRIPQLTRCLSRPTVHRSVPPCAASLFPLHRPSPPKAHRNPQLWYAFRGYFEKHAICASSFQK